jgi:hypothetical protein
MSIVRVSATFEDPSSRHPKRRLVIVERNDGRFSYLEQYYFVSEYEGKVYAEGWASLNREGIYDTADAAEREGLSAMSHIYRGAFS